MKLLFTVVLSLLLTVFTQAESATKIEGMAGIPFGATMNQVTDAMKSRGAAFHRNASTAAQLEFDGGKFNNEDALLWHFHFLRGRLYRVGVGINPPDFERLATYERIKKQISDKYGKPVQETRVEMAAPRLYELVSSGKLVLEANWRDTDPGSRSIACKLVRRGDAGVIIRIIYQDDTIAAQISSKEKEDL